MLRRSTGAGVVIRVSVNSLKKYCLPNMKTERMAIHCRQLGFLWLRFALYWLLLAPGAAHTALPPKYQNTKDLNIIVEFIRQHDRLLAELKRINFEDYTVHYGDGCTASFERQAMLKPTGWVGPDSPLIFKKSTCSLDF